MATNTSANTFDLVKKSAKIGTLHADKAVIGTGPTGGWKSYTPTLGASAALHASDTQYWRYRIDGTTLRVSATIVHGTSAGTTGSGTYTFTLPTGCTMRSLNTSSILGSALVAGGTTQGIGVVASATTTTFYVAIQNSATTVLAWGSSSAADLRFGATSSFSVGLEFCVELDPTCAAVTGTYV